jgi:hypothetical protein
MVARLDIVMTEYSTVWRWLRLWAVIVTSGVMQCSGSAWDQDYGVEVVQEGVGEDGGRTRGPWLRSHSVTEWWLIEYSLFSFFMILVFRQQNLDQGQWEDEVCTESMENIISEFFKYRILLRKKGVLKSYVFIFFVHWVPVTCLIFVFFTFKFKSYLPYLISLHVVFIQGVSCKPVVNFQIFIR